MVHVTEQTTGKWLASPVDMETPTSEAESTTAKHCKIKKLIYCKRIPGVELCTDYTSSWNDKERTKELTKKRKEMLPDELSLVLKTLR